MSDCEKLIVGDLEPHVEDHCQPEVRDHDDLGGVVVGMFGRLDIRELFILWVGFLFLHTELFSDVFLKRINGTTDKDGMSTMKGTFYKSVIMLLLIVICGIVF